MQIVIDIDDKTYKAFTELIAINLGRGIYKSIIEKCLIAIQNGTPLPKGHGKLVDVNSIPKEDRGITVKSLLYPGTIACAGAIDLEEYVNNLPTIIEADKAFKALEERDELLDKIISEIEQITDTMGVSYNQYVSKIDVLQIIDKYIAEI